MSRVEPAFSPAPIFIDGLSTSLSYAILAVKSADEYNCLCLRNNGTFKFYPNYEFWGLTATGLRALGLQATYDRQHYQGVHNTTTEDVQKVLNIVRGQRGAAVVPDHMIAGVFEESWERRQHCRTVHPSVGGHAPSIDALPDVKECNRRVGYDPVLLLGYNGLTKKQRDQVEDALPFHLAFP